MEENKGENLPVVQEEKNLATKRNLSDFLRKAKKIGSGIGILFGGATAAALTTAVGIPVIPVAILGGTVIAGTRNLRDLSYKTEPGLMFVTQKSKDGTAEIYQDALEFPGYLRGISKSDKASIMGLQTMVGFERYKRDLQISGLETFEENGKQVYEPKYSTITHSVNIKNLRALAEAGYIDIISEEDSFYHNTYEERLSFLGFKKRPLRSLLIMEKIGFSNKEGLRDIFDKAIKGDRAGLDELKKDFKKITFRLTDKPIDFEDIYKKVNGYIPYESKEEEKQLKRFRSIFYDSKSRIPGPLSSKKLIRTDGKMVTSDRSIKFDISRDKFGRVVFVPYAEKGFGERIEEEQEILSKQETAKSAQNDFEKELKEGVDFEKISEVERSSSSENKPKEIEDEITY